MPFETVVQKTIEYLAVPSVVGYEGHFKRYLAQDFEKLGLKTEEHEGVLQISSDNPNTTIISAHIDRHGLISSGDGLYTYAAQHVKEVKYNKQDKNTKATLNAISERFVGEHMLAYDPKTGNRLGDGIIENCDPSMRNGDAVFYVEGMEDMPKDIPVGYARSAEAGEELLKGQIDNVVSLGIIYVLFQNGFNGTALLSTEEEIGKSWIHIINWLEKKKIETTELMILDTSPYRESAPVEQGQVVLRNRDKSAPFNPALTAKIKQRCDDLKIPYQFKDEFFLSMGLETKDLGSTELGRIVQNSEGRWSGATVQIPTTEYHTSYETTSRDCIESFYALLQDILVQNPILTER